MHCRRPPYRTLRSEWIRSPDLRPTHCYTYTRCLANVRMKYVVLNGVILFIFIIVRITNITFSLVFLYRKCACCWRSSFIPFLSLCLCATCDVPNSIRWIMSNTVHLSISNEFIIYVIFGHWFRTMPHCDQDHPCLISHHLVRAVGLHAIRITHTQASKHQVKIGFAMKFIVVASLNQNPCRSRLGRIWCYTVNIQIQNKSNQTGLVNEANWRAAPPCCGW